MRVPTLFCDDGSEIELPTVWRICPRCDGHGKSSAYLGAYTRSEMDEAGPDFHDAYMAGEYDRACENCDGTGKVQVVDHSKISADHLAEWRDQCRDEAADRAIERAERAMGA